MPKSVTTAVVTGLVLGAGYLWYKSGYMTEFFKWAMDKLDLFPDETTSNREGLKSIPTLAGAKNQDGYNTVIPLTLGKHRYTPRYCAKPYHTISGTDGEEQTFHAMYMVGYNSVRVTDFKLGSIDLAHNEDFIKDGQTQQVTTVNNGMVEINGFWDAEKYGIQLEIQQGANNDDAYLYPDSSELAPEGEMSLYPEKVVEESLNIELLHTSDDEKILVVNRVSAKNPRVIEVEFTLNGLISYDDKGREDYAFAFIKIEASFDGGNNYVPFGQIIGSDSYYQQTGTSFIQRKKNKVMRFVARRILSYSEAMNCSNRIVHLRIQKTNPKSTDTNTADAVYLSAIRTWCFDYKKSKATEGTENERLVPQAPLIESRRNMTCRVALEIKADELEFKNQIDELNMMIESKTFEWSSLLHKWNSVSSRQQNPASLALMLLAHQCRGKHSYSYPANHTLNDILDKLGKRIDLDSFGEFYEWCYNKRFKCNGVLTSQKKTREILDAILASGRGKLILDNKKYAVWIDKPRDTPVMVLNNQNVISATNSKSFADLPDGFKIKFINEMTWQTDEMKVLRDGVDEDTPNLTYESIELLFQTDADQIWKNGRYLLANKQLRNEVWNRKVSVDGNLIDIGSLIELQDDTISVGIGDGAEIKELVTRDNEIVTIKTDGNFYIDDLTKRYGIRVTCADGVHEPKVMAWEVEITQTGEHNDLTLVNPISTSSTYKPNVGDIVSFGFFEQETTQALCFGKKDNGDGTFDLTLVPYQEGVYTADSGTIPEFISNVCDIPQRSSGTYEPDTTLGNIALVNQITDEKIELAVSEIERQAMQAYIYADITSAGFFVGDDNVTTQDQIIRVLCHVIIGNEERDFTFGSFQPVMTATGFNITTEGHTVIIRVPAGTTIKEGNFTIPIQYRDIYEDAYLVDEDEYNYVDENGDPYYTLSMDDVLATYRIPFGYVGVKGGNYKGGYNAITNTAFERYVTVVENGQTTTTLEATLLFTDCVIGDYITWTGEVTNSQIVKPDVVGQTGKLRTSRLYKFNGLNSDYMWSEDTDQTHTMNGMTDVMQVLSDELEQIPNNNPNGVNYLEKLVANDVFVDRLIANKAFIRQLVSDDAFITNLATKMITLQEGGAIKSFLADNQFTSVTTESGTIMLNTSSGVWKTFESTDRYCCTDTDTENYSSLSYVTYSSITVANLNSKKFLYVRHGASNYTYDKYDLKAYFKLEGDTGKITAKDMVADGGTFTNINANNMTVTGGQFNQINATGGTFTNINAIDGNFKGTIYTEDLVMSPIRAGSYTLGYCGSKESSLVTWKRYFKTVFDGDYDLLCEGQVNPSEMSQVSLLINDYIVETWTAGENIDEHIQVNLSKNDIVSVNIQGGRVTNSFLRVTVKTNLNPNGLIWELSQNFYGDELPL